MTCSKGGVFRDILLDVVFTDKSIGTSTDKGCIWGAVIDPPFGVLSVLHNHLHYDSYNCMV